MRGKKAILNTIMNLSEEFVAIICSLIIPRLILNSFGSAYNGLVSSITQFLSCAVILRSGIGAATKTALYRPLNEKDEDSINSIIKATDIHMKKIGLILLFAILSFAVIYPIFVKSEFEWFFTFSLFCIIGISTFSESFFGITYMILLQADQKLYVSSIIKIFCNILNVILTVILILSGFSIHFVKLASALAFTLYPVIISIYVHKKYNINSKVKPNNEAIKQRWDAFWHQLSTFVNNNTDVMILTVFTNMLEVSVYSVYSMIINALKRFITSFTGGLDAAFGNMIAKNELKTVNENLTVIEFIIYNLATILFSCATCLILQFVEIYTNGVTDVNYMRPFFAYILLFAQLFYAIRLPYQIIIQAAGHFHQTKKYAIIEAILNIVISIILVIKYGLIGVAIGTLIALLYKTITFSNYASKKIINRSIFTTYKKCFIATIEYFSIVITVKLINLPIQLNYINWIFNAIITIILSLIIVTIGILLFYRKDFSVLKYKLKRMHK